MKLVTAWIIVIIFSTALIGGFFVLKKISSGTASAFTLGTTSTTSPQATFVAHVPSEKTLQEYKEYRSNEYHFSIQYPSDIPPQESHDLGHTMTLDFQQGAGEKGFEIYVAPVSGNEITQEQFLRDEPSGVRQDPTTISVDGTQALAFHGFNAAIGQTYEVWFIHGPFLYEITTYKELETGFNNKILSTWRFI